MAVYHRLPHAAGQRGRYPLTTSVEGQPAVAGRVKGLVKNLRTRRNLRVTAVHLPSARGRLWVCALDGAEGVLGAASSGQLFAKFEDLTVDRSQRGRCVAVTADLGGES